MRNRKQIIFKTIAFPVISETFITNHLIMTLKNGFDLSLIVNKKNTIYGNSAQEKIIKDNGLYEKTTVLKDYDISTFFKKIKFIICGVLNNGFLFKYLKSFNYFKYGKKGFKGNLFYKLYQIKDFLSSEIIHIQFGICQDPFIELKKFNLIRQKIIVTFHGFDAHFNESTFENKKEYYRDLFKYADLITVNTPYLKNQIIELGCNEKKIQVIPMPVDTDYFIPILKKEKNEIFSVLSVGRLVNFKGHIYGIKAISNLVKRGYNISYSIIGEGEERQSLENEIERLNLEKHVKLLGVRDQQYVKEKMQNADVFLMTSITDRTDRKETQGVVTIEAQSCGIPVVAFNSGGVPYTIINESTGFLCNEQNVDEFSNKIEILIKNESIRKKMGESARDFVLSNYSNNVISKIWKDLYSH